MYSLLTLFHSSSFVFFFFNDTATTEIYTLSLHDALPISIRPPSSGRDSCHHTPAASMTGNARPTCLRATSAPRSEEHTSELQSPCNLVCRLLLEKKNGPFIVESPRMRMRVNC